MLDVRGPTNGAISDEIFNVGCDFRYDRRCSMRLSTNTTILGDVYNSYVILSTMAFHIIILPCTVVG